MLAIFIISLIACVVYTIIENRNSDYYHSQDLIGAIVIISAWSIDETLGITALCVIGLNTILSVISAIIKKF